jgi:hypothetical protein
MAGKIQRPGGAARAAHAEEDSIEVPFNVMRDALLAGYFSWAEVEAITATTTGVLGAWETVALFGAVMGTAGAGVLFVLGAAALLKWTSRSELAETNSTIGVITSPGGLPVMAAMQAAGYSTKESVRLGEYAKATFTAYKLQHDTAKEYEGWKEESSAANDMREIRNFIHERFEVEKPTDGERQAEPAPPWAEFRGRQISDEEWRSLFVFDRPKGVNLATTALTQTGAISAAGQDQAK